LPLQPDPKGIFMNFDFSEDQRRLQEEVRRVLTDISTSAEVRTVLDGAAPYSAKTWRHLADLGALGIAIPADYGGTGLGHLELCLVAEEAGRALAAVPLLSSIYLAAEAIKLAGSQAQKSLWLPRIANGDVIATAVLDPRAQTLAKGEALAFANGTLTGTIDALPDGMIAQIAVFHVDNRLVLVDLAAAGVTRSQRASLDPARPLAKLSFAGVAAEELPMGDAKTIARRITHGAAVLLAFEQVGGAERALYATRDYALQRRAFGRVIGSFQSVKHKLADMFAAIEVARAHAWFGAWAMATDAAELPRAAAAARVAATDAYTLAAEEGLHLHGGIGYTWEMDCHMHLRRARWLGQIIGTSHIWRETLASALIAEAA
jgi:acyl-CoA dehydrogenase